jgi:hypothetical protein
MENNFSFLIGVKVAFLLNLFFVNRRKARTLILEQAVKTPPDIIARRCLTFQNFLNP